MTIAAYQTLYESRSVVVVDGAGMVWREWLQEIHVVGVVM